MYSKREQLFILHTILLTLTAMPLVRVKETVILQAWESTTRYTFGQ